MSPGSSPIPPGLLGQALHFSSSSTERLWRPRTFNTNYVCAAENYSSRAFAACCDGPVTNSVVPVEAKAAVSPGGVCAAYCYVDEMRMMAPNARNPRGYSDYYVCLVEMSGEGGRSGLKSVHGEWTVPVNNGERDSTENDDAGATHRDQHKQPHQSDTSPIPVPFDLDSDTGELIFPSSYAGEEDELRKRSTTTDETIAPDADSSGSNIKHKFEDPGDIKLDPKLADPDDAAQNNQTIAPDRPLPTTSTPLANSTTTATPTIETGFTTAPGPTTGGENNTSTLPTQTGTETEAPNAGQPTSTSAAAATAGRLKENKGAWGAGKWGCLVAVLVGGWAVVW
ncbi:hypothetical protein IWZ03DRAFT_164484 [Phyllosticta citriasiana]|uniref:Uncharacterized protein n=1 Tax=Phyllosticta citriasiana TaxID=595635 RepID=A0ABR1KRU1_9PEZI